MDIRDYTAGDYLIRQGNCEDFLLILIEGTASVRVRRADGTTISFAELGRGGLVGEISLLTDEARTADVICLTRVSASILSADNFNRIALEYPELFLLLTNLVAERLGRSTYDSLSSKHLHGYRIERCVGRGGMGIVYEATRSADNKKVALKMMNHRLLFRPEAVRRFQREAAALKTLTHPAIARLFDQFGAYRTQFLAMEFCEGYTLSQVLTAHTSLDETAVRRIVGQLASALKYVHNRHLVHRDLKPSNIMLSTTGQVKLLDFGLAKEYLPESGVSSRETTGSSSLTGSLGCVGTPRYMAPEQFSGLSLDHRVDWHALASVAYEALAGRPVVEARELFAIVTERHLFKLPIAQEIGGGVSHEMHAFLDGGLRESRDDRSIDLDNLSRWAGPVDLPPMANDDDAPTDPEAETVSNLSNV